MFKSRRRNLRKTTMQLLPMGLCVSQVMLPTTADRSAGQMGHQSRIGQRGYGTSTRQPQTFANALFCFCWLVGTRVML